MSDVNWNLAQVPNLFASAVQAQRAGQQDRDVKAAREALTLYNTDPRGGIAALRPVDPESAYRLEREQEDRRVRALAEKREDERRRALSLANGGDFTGAQAAANGDPDTIRAIRDMSEEDRKRSRERAAVLYGVFRNAEKMTPDQAEAYKRQVAPSLISGGLLTQEQIDGFQMTPQNIAAKKAEALTLAELLDQDWKERELKLKADDIAADNERDRKRLGIQQQNADAGTFRAHKPPAVRGAGRPTGRVLGATLDPNDGW